MKKYIINSLLFLGILALIGSCNTSEKRVEEEVIEDKITSIIEITKEQFENSKMEIGSVSIQNFNESIKTNGLIDVPPANRAIVSSVMGGYIKKIPMLIGDDVKKGQLLARCGNSGRSPYPHLHFQFQKSQPICSRNYLRQSTLNL